MILDTLRTHPSKLVHMKFIHLTPRRRLYRSRMRAASVPLLGGLRQNGHVVRSTERGFTETMGKKEAKPCPHSPAYSRRQPILTRVSAHTTATGIISEYGERPIAPDVDILSAAGIQNFVVNNGERMVYRVSPRSHHAGN